MSRPIFKFVGVAIIAGAVLFFIPFLIFKVVLFLFILRGILKLSFRNKFRRKFNRVYFTPLDAYDETAALPKFQNGRKNFGNDNALTINIQ